MSDLSQAFETIAGKRRSLRAFLPQPIDQVTLDKVFNCAQRAPSNCNTQPWIAHVVSGAPLEKLRTEMPSQFMEGKMSIDFPYDGSYEGAYKERQYGSAMALYDAVGVAREDKAGRHMHFMRNFTFFDAPHVVFMFLPEPFGLREAADMGMYAQTLMLALTANGLGSCPQTALSFQADLIRETLGVDGSNKLVFGISFGYPDPDAPVNNCTTDRAPLTDTVTFHQ